jgi:hypothetical protein
METAIIQSEEIKIPPITVDLVKWNANAILAEQTAKDIVISSDEENEMAINTLSSVKKYFKEIEKSEDESLKPVNTLKARIKDLYRPIIDSFTASEKIIKDKMLEFAKEKEAERKRLEAERQKKFEEEQAKAREIAKEKQRLADLEAKKNKTAPVVVEVAYVEPPKPILEEKTVKTGSASSTIIKSWKGEVSNPMEILKSIVAGKVSIAVIDFKQIELNNFAKAKKVEGVFDGIKVYEDQRISAK